jgi:hypothetical protein
MYRQVDAIDFERTRVGTFVDLAPTRVYDKLHVDPARSNGFGADYIYYIINNTRTVLPIPKAEYAG